MFARAFLPLVAAMCLAPSVGRAASIDFERLYAFGDSYSDSGAGYVDSNGPTAVVYMARTLGIPFTWAGDPNASGDGLNFAVSAAQTGRREGYRIRPYGAPCCKGEALLGRGMRNQVDDFIAQTRGGRVRWSPGHTLFFIAGGLNDGALPSAATIDNLAGEIRDLHAAGGRSFLVATLPVKIAAFSAVGERLNPEIIRMVASLTQEFPDSRIVASRWGRDFDEIVESPAKFGFKDVKTGCAKRAVFGEDATPCRDPAAHFFYHEAHPSTRAHAIVGARLAEEVRQTF